VAAQRVKQIMLPEKLNVGDLVMIFGGESTTSEIGIVLDIGKRVATDEFVVIEQALVRWLKDHKSSWVSLNEIKVISGVGQ